MTVCIAIVVILLVVVLVQLNTTTPSEEPSATAAPIAAVTSAPSSAAFTTTLAMAEDFATDPSLMLTPIEGFLYDAQGKTYQVSDLATTPLLLFFWSSWCEDCHEMMAQVDAIKAVTESLGAQLILVCRLGVQGESVDSAQSYLAQNGYSVDTYYDIDATLYNSLDLHWVPSLVTVNRHGVIVGLQSGYATIDEVESYVQYASGLAQEQTSSFIINELWSIGGISARYTLLADHTIDADSFYLSETQGLMMEYAVGANDQALFDEVLHFTSTQMTVDGLCTWLIEDGVSSAVNATLDDLRIVGALFDANDQWGSYLAFIEPRATALYEKTVAQDQLVDFADLSLDLKASTLTLCYVDFLTLEDLSETYPQWTAVLQNATAIVEGGYLSDTFPLYYPRYDYELGAYTGTELHTAEALVTLLHLAEVGMIKSTTVDFLERWINSGAVYARYTTDGFVVAGYEYESTAIYALIARIGLLTGRDELCINALRLMENFRQRTGDFLNGSYGFSGEIYTFDTLQALLTLQSMSD